MNWLLRDMLFRELPINLGITVHLLQVLQTNIALPSGTRWLFNNGIYSK